MKNRTFVVGMAAVVLLGAIAGQALAQQAPNPPPGRDIAITYLSTSGAYAIPTKPDIVGTEIVVSANDPVSARVTYDLYQRGGNLFDAAVPGMWMTMVMSNQYLPGTAVYTLFDAESGRVHHYGALGTACAACTIENYKAFGINHVPTNGQQLDGVGAFLRMSMVAEPDGSMALLERFGTMSFTDVMQDVLVLFEEGTPARWNWLNMLNSPDTFNTGAYIEPAQADQWVENRAIWRQFTDAGETAVIGSLVKDPGSANAIRIMMAAEQKALAAGATREEGIRAARDEFYKGQIARDFAAFIQENGGLHTYEDFANYEARWYDQDELPHGTYMGYDFYSDPTYTQSGLYILYINMIKNFDLYEIGYMTPDYLNLLAQIFALGMADRWQWFGDPDFVDVPEGLWTEEYGRVRASLIDLERGPFDAIPHPGDPINMKAILEGWEEPAELYASGRPGMPEGLSWSSIDVDELKALHDAMAGGSMDTTSFVIADTKGNMFNYCPSDGRNGAVPSLPGYGFGISMRARQYTLIEGHAGAIEPGKRPVSTPHTSLITKDGQPYMALSSVSGDEQTMGLFMITLNNIVWGMSPQLAIEQPKLVTNNLFSHFTPHFTRYDPSALRLEIDDMPEETVAALEDLGYVIERRANWVTVGTAVMVVFHPDLGTVVGGSNPRNHNYTIGR